MPPARTRSYYVLAENAAKADEVILRLREFGIKSVNFVNGTWPLLGLDQTKVTFVFGPGHQRHPMAKQIRNIVDTLISLGATVKPPPPPRPLPEPEPAPEPKADRAENVVDLNRFFQRTVLDSSATGPKPFQGFRPKEAKVEGPYKQVHLGGPKHGRRNRLAVALGTSTIAWIDVPPITLADLNTPPMPTVNRREARRYDVDVFGAKVTFWVDEREWAERNALVRDYLLFPLEV